VLKSFLKLIKNKKFLISLLAVNTITFFFGLILDHLDLMLLSVMSYAAILLSIELNQDSPNDEDG
jgi:hypothetical protein